jgi:hypothetical protein
MQHIQGSIRGLHSIVLYQDRYDRLYGDITGLAIYVLKPLVALSDHSSLVIGVAEYSVLIYSSQVFLSAVLHFLLFVL